MRIDTLVLTFLLNALWQVPAVAAAGLAGERLLHRAPARLRHGLWLAVVALCVMLPAAGLVRLEEPLPSVNSTRPGTDSSTDGYAWLDWLPEGPRPARVSPSASSAALVVYGFLVLLRALQLGRAWRRTRALARRARPLEMPEPMAPLVARCRKALGVERAVILTSDEVSGPVTLGALRPAILLPTGFLDGASPAEAVSALGHELAHVRRRDYAVNFLCEALLLPVAFHPAVRLLRRRLAEAREMACDEAALESLIGRRAYARSLLSLAAAGAGLARPSITLGVVDAPTLEARMKRILDLGPLASTRRSRALLGTALLLLAGVGAGAASFSVAAVAAGTGDLTPFVGTWSGDWPAEMVGRGGVHALDIEVRPNGEIVETFYRYRKAAGDPIPAGKVARSVSSYKVAGTTLTLTIQTDDFELPNGQSAPAEIEGALELQGRDTALFTTLRHSYFEAAKKRGEQVPPPPPPIPMQRQPAAAAGS